jgi:hypothetical protein
VLRTSNDANETRQSIRSVQGCHPQDSKQQVLEARFKLKPIMGQGKMTEPIDLTAKRFAKATDPKDHAPMDALYAALRWIKECEKEGYPIEHVMVITGRTTEDGGSSARYFQTGKYPYHAQLGLITEGALMLREDG